LDLLLGQEPNSKIDDFVLDKNNFWYPEFEMENEYFYALNIKTDPNYGLGEKAHLFDRDWQLISENATNDIKLSFTKSK
jgi:hypothetical protein